MERYSRGVCGLGALSRDGRTILPQRQKKDTLVQGRRRSQHVPSLCHCPSCSSIVWNVSRCRVCGIFLTARLRPFHARGPVQKRELPACTSGLSLSNVDSSSF